MCVLIRIEISELRGPAYRTGRLQMEMKESTYVPLGGLVLVRVQKRRLRESGQQRQAQQDRCKEPHQPLLIAQTRGRSLMADGLSGLTGGRNPHTDDPIRVERRQASLLCWEFGFELCESILRSSSSRSNRTTRDNQKTGRVFMANTRLTLALG